MATHELKTWKIYFNDIIEGKKNFELRKNDRGYNVGDTLILKEYDNEVNAYTGRLTDCTVEYILHGGQFGLEEGYVIMGIN